MRPGDIRVAVDGIWLQTLCHVSQVTFSSRYGDGPCGPDLASVEIELEPRSDTGYLRMGRTLQVFDRGVLKFGGPITNGGRGRVRTVEAKSWARRDWDSTANPAPGARIGRNADGTSFTPTAPTTPTWLLDASDLDIGVADDRLYTRVIASYVSAVGTPPDPDTVSTVTADDLVAQALYDVIPFELDLTDLGLISGATAASYANQQLAEFAIPEWTSRIVTTATRLRTANGLPAHLGDAQAGQMVRMFHMPTTFGGTRKAAATDVVLGEVEYSTSSPLEITLAPARVAVRSVADVVRQIAETRRLAEQAA